MTIDNNDLLNSILASLDRVKCIDPEDIPSIDLYMDQVTTFMDSQLRSSVRYPGEDKILTKTMINNYAKNDLLPPPVKKKYSKEHVLLLVFIYYYKGILSIGDIQKLLHPITERFFQGNGSFNLESVYKEAFSMEEAQIEALKADVTQKFRVAEGTFHDAPKESRGFLQKFAFICALSFDVYLKKLLIEKLVDELAEPVSGKEKEKEKVKEKEEKEEEKENQKGKEKKNNK